MEWKLFASSFAIVFLAELGDKTQIVTFAQAVQGSARWSVFLGAALALVLTSAIAVLLGGLVGKHVPELWLRRVAGAAFVLLGLWYLVRGGEPAVS